MSSRKCPDSIVLQTKGRQSYFNDVLDIGLTWEDIDNMGRDELVAEAKGGQLKMYKVHGKSVKGNSKSDDIRAALKQKYGHKAARTPGRVTSTT